MLADINMPFNGRNNAIKSVDHYVSIVFEAKEREAEKKELK